MNSLKSTAKCTETRTPTAVTDAAGMIWAHSNPAQLYRWIAQRNALLDTIDVAFARCPLGSPRPMAS